MIEEKEANLLHSILHRFLVVLLLNVPCTVEDKYTMFYNSNAFINMHKSKYTES